MHVVGLVWLTACGPSTQSRFPRSSITTAPSLGEPISFRGARSDAAQRTSDVLVGWVEARPDGCAVGSSGPTRNPADAIRSARLSALEGLAEDSLEIDVQTISGSGPTGSFEISAQALSGTLTNARVVALWADTDKAGVPGARVRQVYALACWPDALPREVSRPDYPTWLIDPPEHDGRICATGISGPTRRSGDQPEGALRDARHALAAALESRIEKRIFDDGRGVVKKVRRIDPSRAALARAATASQLERDWFDVSGSGPIGLPGVLYGLACIED
ncbi:MAG: hypothetical protein CL908_11495 [Deltaproteobacteria bacterium]|jgi:hypothetical protein|nr:hypothetical protein [Deltaproteobacteria bacterium]